MSNPRHNSKMGDVLASAILCVFLASLRRGVEEWRAARAGIRAVNISLCVLTSSIKKRCYVKWRRGVENAATTCMAVRGAHLQITQWP